jgi:hypothetical protein
MVLVASVLAPRLGTIDDIGNELGVRYEIVHT